MMHYTRRSFLAASAALAALPFRTQAQPARRIAIATDPLESLGDYGLGIRLGATEAERAAMLLGHDFLLVADGKGTAHVTRVAPSASDVPVVAMSGTSSSGCVFVTSGAPDPPRGEVPSAQGATITDWHHEFRRYGAGELNERFQKAFDRPMTADAWHGWVAVKAIVEAAIRGDDLCVQLAQLRFDGHKGRALSFDPATRRLRHPRLSVRTEGEKQIVEVVP